jgi:hypothetical protein
MDMNNHSRRTFLKSVGLTTGGLAMNGLETNLNALDSASLNQSIDQSADQSLTLSDRDIRETISQSDLMYSSPVPRSEEGIPVGNGRMGSLVWTTPGQLHFQINRVDVYPSNCTSNSFFQAHEDYCGGCAFLDIDFGEDSFPETGFRQHLSIYDGNLSIDAQGLSIRITPSASQDVIAVEVDDHRTTGAAVSATLRMLRYETRYFGAQSESLALDHMVKVQHRSHTATSQLITREDAIALAQDFREGTHCCKSAVAVGFEGRQGRTQIVNETDVRLTAIGKGKTIILIASAATFDQDSDVTAAAFQDLDSARTKGSAALTQESQDWWRTFWSRSFVQLHNGDGVADFVQQNYHYFLYLMAATSRGKLPPKFNGMLWNTGGDQRAWGSQHWFMNLSCYYEALPATGRFELMDPMYDMYSGMLDSCGRAARQQWGSQGIYIPETVHFDGLEELPETIATEMRELYLLQRPWEQRSEQFQQFPQTKLSQSSRWNWIVSGKFENGRYEITERGFGPYGPTSHMLSSQAKVAILYWQRYEYTLDREWLRDRAYPLLRGVVEFYRNFPNLKKDVDGKYHIHWTNSGEPVFGARDSIEDICAIRSTTAALLRASEILDVDQDMQPVWREFLEHLAPLPTSDHQDALHPADYQGPRIFVSGLKPAVKADRTPNGWMQDINSLPIWFFDLCNAESLDREMFAVAQASFDRFLHDGLRPEMPVGGMSMLGIAAASLGRADAIEILLPNQMRAFPVQRSATYKKAAQLENRMTLLEGAQSLGAEHLGRAAEAMHRALIQSNPPEPGGEPILHLFPAWPLQWDARFTLSARGGFVVTASIKNGTVRVIELRSMAGSSCRLRNPFHDGVVLFRNGREAEHLRGSLLEFKTNQGEQILVKSKA